MDSLKVTIGQTAESSQYNNLRKDVLHAGYYQIDVVTSDETNIVTEETVGIGQALGFAGSGTSTISFNVQIPPMIATDEDWKVRISFDMDGSNASKAAVFSLDYASIASAGDTTPSVTTLTETVTTPDTLEELKVVTLSTIKIPQAALSAGKLVNFKLSRLAGDAADTNTAMLRLFTLQLIQDQT